MPSQGREQTGIRRKLKVSDVEKWWIEKSRRNFYYFMTYLSGGERRPADHQLQWAVEILNPDNNKVNLIAPRGSGKTEIGNYIMAWYIGKYPHLNNFIGSVSQDQARKRLDAVRDLIQHNPRYKNVFPWIQIDTKQPNKSDEFTVSSTQWKGKKVPYNIWQQIRSTQGDAKSPTLFASSVGSKSVVGSRFTGLAIMDDPHDEENSATQHQRDKVDEFIRKTLLPCLVPNGVSKMVIISTRWHQDDMAGRLKSEVNRHGQPIWKTLEISAINNEGESYWPEVWPIEILMDKKDEIQAVAFELMYMNNPMGKSSGDFTLDGLNKRIARQLPLSDFVEVIITVDVAYSLSTRADYTVYTAMARTGESKFRVFVLDCVRFKENKNSVKTRKLEQFADRMFQMYGRLDGVYFQHVTGEVALSLSLEEARRDIPVKTVRTMGDKSSRLKAVTDFYIWDRIFFNSKCNNLTVMFGELVDFPGTHDDIVDTLSLAFQIDKWRTKNRVTSKRYRIKSSSMI